MEGKKDIAISIQDVYKSFECKEILHGITYEFEEGKIHGIIGKKASGKSILFKCICGISYPTKGKIFVNHQLVDECKDFQECTGIIIETHDFFSYRKDKKKIQILMFIRNKLDDKMIYIGIKRVGLNPKSKKNIPKCSPSMRQILEIIRANMRTNQVLLLDEPFNGFDKYTVADMKILLKELKTNGKTIVLATNKAKDMDKLCDTVSELDGGKLKTIK